MTGALLGALVGFFAFGLCSISYWRRSGRLHRWGCQMRSNHSGRDCKGRTS